MRNAVAIGLVLVGLAAGCGPRSAIPAPPGVPAGRVVVLRGEPACPFRVVGRVEAVNRDGRGPVTELVRLARSYSAHAIVDVRPSLSRGTWEATAIQFSDPSNPRCYR